MELDTGIEDPESPAQWVVSAAPNNPTLTQPIWKSNKSSNVGLITFNAMETRRN